MNTVETVEALLKCIDRIARLEIELEQAKAERKELEEVTLPPMFLQERVGSIDLTNGARATKNQYAYARLAKVGDPRRQAMLDWLRKVGEQDAIKATLVAKWGTGDYETAQQFHKAIVQAGDADVNFGEDVHWKTLESIVMQKIRAGLEVPLTDINATFGDRVTIVRYPKHHREE